MSKKRERFEVIHDMLVIVREKNKVGPTRLLQLANLSPKMFKEYTKELTENKLIEKKEIKSKKKYIITDKGLKFLERYHMFSKFVDELGL